MIKKPKYKVGDIIVYKDRYPESDEESSLIIYQSRIIESFAAVHPNDDTDILWFYITEQTEKESVDYLIDCEILFKLN